MRTWVVCEEIDTTYALCLFGMEQFYERCRLPSFEVRTALQKVVGIGNDPPARKQTDLSIFEFLKGKR